MRTGVVHSDVGATPRPDDMDTLIQAEAVAAGLTNSGHEVLLLPARQPVRHVLEELDRKRVELVFNLVETLGGTSESAYLLPSALEQASLPFTGAGSQALLVSGNKLAAKRLMRSAGISTPIWEESGASVGTSSSDSRFWPGPYIVKSVWEHGSHGLDADSVMPFASKAAIHSALARKQRESGGAWFAEAYVAGREFCVGILEQEGHPRVLPIYEIHFTGEAESPWLVDYAAKWDESSDMAQATSRRWEFQAEDQWLLDRMEATALHCWRLFRLSGYARVDMRVDSVGVVHVFDVNANPCLSQDAGFAAQLERAGLDLNRGLEHIVDAAMRSRNAPHTDRSTRKAA
ncbi:MAG: D-alanine--D-alanine ligase family protein [Oceanidesulfovibrio sp.]